MGLCHILNDESATSGLWGAAARGKRNLFPRRPHRVVGAESHVNFEGDVIMSGPKYSQAELERMRQAELERQRQERLRRIREATEQYQQVASRYEQFGARVSSSGENELKLAATVEELDMARQTYISAKSEIAREIKKQLTVPLPGEPEEISALSGDMQEKLATLEGALQKDITAFSDRLSVYYNSQTELARSKEFSQALDAMEKEKKWEYSNFRFDSSTEERPGAALSRGSGKDIDVEQIIAECTALINDSAINQEDRRRLIAVLDRLKNNSGANEVQNRAALASQYEALRGGVKRNIRVFNDYYLQYCALHIEWRRMVGESKNPPAQPLPRSAFASAVELEQEIQRLDILTKTENERAYIREQMDDVMRLFGYKVAESIVLRGSSKGNHYLFESERGDAPIHCFVSDGQRIMLETVGLDNLDEGGADGHEGIAVVNLTDAEKMQIVEQQKSFCAMHPKITEELRKRGVIINHVKLTEVGEKHAKVLRIKGKQSNLRRADERGRIRRDEKKLRAIDK